MQEQGVYVQYTCFPKKPEKRVIYTGYILSFPRRRIKEYALHLSE
jgi:hypothetical protein